MKIKYLTLIILIAVFLTTISYAHASEGFLSKVKGFFSGQGKEAPEYQCKVSFANIDTNSLITINEDCKAYFIKHGSKGQICQLYSYNVNKGIKQCDFCIDKFLSKSDRKIPKTCLSAIIEKTHFTEEDMDKIILDNKDEIEKKMNMNEETIKAEYVGVDVEVGRITYSKGNTAIIRKSRMVPAIVGEGLICGDQISVQKGAEVTIILDSENIKINENTIFKIPACKEEAESSKIVLFFKNAWNTIKEKIRGESFEAKTLTATAGVRG
jgi:hypothetical protein